jgi:hypothetical protein
MSGKVPVDTPLHPRRRAYLERQREFLSDLEEADPEGLALAQAALDPDAATEDELDQDDHHLATEFRYRSSV